MSLTGMYREALPPAQRPGEGSIAICMATYNPEPTMLRQQIRSIQAQSVEDWLCFISDDSSTPDFFQNLVAEIRGDDRFVLSQAPQRLGVYRNFERALSMVPAGINYVALSDQDDDWFPNKLAVLRDHLHRPGVQLAYSDFRIVDERGAVVADSLWRSRKNSFERVDLLGVFNTVTGAAAMFPRELLTRALPFPPMLGAAWHDHWLTLLALSRGELAYVDEALFDHVHHGRNVSGDIFNKMPGRRRLRLPRRRSAEATLDLYRHHYLFGVRYIENLAEHLQARVGSQASRDKQCQIDRLVHLSRSSRSLAWVTTLAAHRLRPDDFMPSRSRDLLRGILYARASRWAGSVSRARSAPDTTRPEGAL